MKDHNNTVEGAFDFASSVVGLALAVLVGWTTWWVVRYLHADAMTRQSIRQAVRIRRGWKRLAPMLKLSATDKTPTALASLANTDGKPIRPRVLIPALKVTHDAYGVIARANCLPGVGLQQFQKAAPHLADAWRCTRVAITQDKPGRVLIRGVRLDPLKFPTEHRPTGDEPTRRLGGTWASTSTHSPCP
ncbi:hypothetical protein [Streptomyces sp. NBC_01235]|uniref:hypothetical protein n=1 Tax=Streptomyces sp. NBC_01235 TaxID=2903788 RepID=UPI002E163D5F|nr:hypothetical protein OG289_25170 [Streptomyces sp. NBC_01235]